MVHAQLRTRTKTQAATQSKPSSPQPPAVFDQNKVYCLRIYGFSSLFSHLQEAVVTQQLLQVMPSMWQGCQVGRQVLQAVRITVAGPDLCGTRAVQKVKSSTS